MGSCVHNNSQQDTLDNKNNGLITRIWGRAGWTFGHCVTFGYPIEPTDEQKEKFRTFFTSLGDVLPCKYCRESYHKFITSGDTELNDDALSNRETLTKWFYRVHNAVNDKLEVKYAVDYDDIVDKYESFRARCGKSNTIEKGCLVPLDYKAFSFNKMYNFDAPIIDINLARPFITVANFRLIDKDLFVFSETAIKYNGDFSIMKKMDLWKDRNRICQKQIKYMRTNAIESIEDNGPWKGTPTIDELKLLVCLSSNLCHTELLNAYKTLMNNLIFRSIQKN